MKQKIKEIRIEVNDLPDDSGNYSEEVYEDGELVSDTIFNAIGLPIDELSVGELRTRTEYNGRGLITSCRQYAIDANGEEDLVLQEFTEYDAEGRITEYLYQNIEGENVHRFYEYTKEQGVEKRMGYNEEGDLVEIKTYISYRDYDNKRTAYEQEN